MYNRYLNIFNHPSERTLAKAAILGPILDLHHNCDYHSKLPIAFFDRIISPAIRHGSLKVFFDQRGDPIAYVVWAYLSPQVEQRIFETGNFVLHISEWNEGDSLWILDFLAPFGHCRRVLRSLVDDQFKSHKTLTYFRPKNGSLEFFSVPLSVRSMGGMEVALTIT